MASPRWHEAALAMALLLLPAAAPAPARQAELRHLLLHDCGSCHGMTMRGGLGSPLLPGALADRSDAALIGIILDGIRGTPMPPWVGELSEEDAAWMVRILREGVAP